MSLRQQNKAKARQNILAAAQSLIAQQGMAQTTTRAIAKAAGISYQTLYNYFPTKAHIVHALMEADMQAWSQAVDNTIKQYSGDVLATLDEMNRVSLEHFGSEKLELWRQVSAQIFLTDMSKGAAEFASINKIAHERYYALLKLAQGMGQLRSGIDLHLLAHTLFCLSDYALLRFIFNKPQQLRVFRRTLNEQLALVLQPYMHTPPQQSENLSHQ